MKLEYIAKPGRSPLTLDDVKTYLRIEGDAENVLLESLILAACEFCEEYQHRVYGSMSLRLTVSTAEAQADIELPRSKSLENEINVYTRDGQGQEVGVENYTLSYSSVNTVLRIEETLPVDADLVVEYQVKGECNETALLAMRLLVAHWYENRLAADNRGMNEVPFTITALLNPGRILL